jgi:hypothetical protein
MYVNFSSKYTALLSLSKSIHIWKGIHHLSVPKLNYYSDSYDKLVIDIYVHVYSIIVPTTFVATSGFTV